MNTYLFHIPTNNTHSLVSEKYRALATVERLMGGLTNGPHLGRRGAGCSCSRRRGGNAWCLNWVANGESGLECVAGRAEVTPEDSLNDAEDKNRALGSGRNGRGQAAPCRL